MSRFKGGDVEENVSCNLIPMIDIMFLLLLFFMLSADMTQRVAEDIPLPIAEHVKEDPKQKEGYETTTVNLVGENGVWFVKIAGTAYPDWGVLKAHFTDLSLNSPDPTNKPGARLNDPNNPYYSSRAIMLRADANAPYKEVQRLIQTCAKTGLWKIEVVAVKPPPEGAKAG